MNDKISSISVFWKTTEKKSVEECAEMAFNFLLFLKDYDNYLFGIWYEKGYSKKEALENKVELSTEYFQNAFQKNWDKKFDDLGSRIAYWTGHEEGKSGQISIKLGAYGDKSFNKNSCVIDLPYEDGFFSQSKAKGLIELMSDYWKPDRILVNGEEVENVIT